ncbi:MAG: pyrimidine-nucleoside phosphorylase [Eubacteriales bacterium]|nr:pyrimidine-nucleoside phosphorylase [Eubacteriales bacterium]
MDMLGIIEKKKKKQELSPEEIDFFAKGAADGSIPDYQLSALLMAIRLNGMSRQETVALTLSMAHSGDMMDLSSIPGVPADKHSTGGVGDTTTLVLVPLVAACGVPVAKMSGRGLGHTGGTLDKLESIPGFTIGLSEDAFLKQVREIGCAVIGQTKNLAPADKSLYALRDVTATVDSLPLIASSIVSKKLASGAQAIVLDVKTGAGALMQTTEESIELAQAMVRIGCDAGRKMVALVTDMGQPLGSHVGNALEVKEAIDVLSGRVTGPLLDVSLMLGARMLLLGGVVATVEDGQQKLTEALHNGNGLEKLRQMIVAQGGDPACCDDPSKLPQAKIIVEVVAPTDGYIEAMDTIRMGNAAQAMGAGRKQKTDVIDYSVGFVLHKRIGDSVSKGEPLFTLHANRANTVESTAKELLESIHLSPTPTAPGKLLHAFVDSEHIERF